jgi:hypothetical protein
MGAPNCWSIVHRTDFTSCDAGVNQRLDSSPVLSKPESHSVSERTGHAAINMWLRAAFAQYLVRIPAIPPSYDRRKDLQLAILAIKCPGANG